MSISTSQAVKSVVSFIVTRFRDLNYTIFYNPLSFYDINRDFEPQFQQYYTNLSNDVKLKPYLAIMFSYDPPDNNDVVQRRSFMFNRRMSNGLYLRSRVCYVSTSLLITLVTNDGDYVDSAAEDAIGNFSRDFNTYYSDLMYLPWQSNKQFLAGDIIRPTSFNNKLYQCIIAGTSNENEPSWSTDTDATFNDNNIVWSCIEPKQLNVRTFNFVKNNYTQSDYQKEGIRYKLEFGCKITYPVVMNSGILHDGKGNEISIGYDSNISGSVMPSIEYSRVNILSYIDEDYDNAKLLDTITLDNT